MKVVHLNGRSFATKAVLAISQYITGQPKHCSSVKTYVYSTHNVVPLFGQTATCIRACPISDRTGEPTTRISWSNDATSLPVCMIFVSTTSFSFTHSLVVSDALYIVFDNFVNSDLLCYRTM